MQQLTYNAFKKPVEIKEEGNTKVKFDYNPISMSRATAYYGYASSGIGVVPEPKYIKHYSSIIPVEITEDILNGTVKISTFVGGDAYSAPIVHINKTPSEIAGTPAIDSYQVP